MTLLEIFERDGLLKDEPNILAEIVMNNDRIKPHEVKMYVKRETKGMYIYTFEARTGVWHWTLQSRTEEEVRDGASRWTAEVGGDPIGTCEDSTKEGCVLEVVARTMCAFDKGMVPTLDRAVLGKGTKINLLRYLTRNMNRYQKICEVYSK